MRLSLNPILSYRSETLPPIDWNRAGTRGSWRELKNLVRLAAEWLEKYPLLSM